ncbi:MAG: type I restriction endonuclease [Thiotrichaceae bacterium]|nr:type I restriction endonuclease [Thiotrichaceae bacterium]
MKKFNENARVKLPCILHLTRLGYKYLPLKHAVRDKQNNIFTDIFKQSIVAINPNATPEDINRLLTDIKLMLDYDDLGKAFYKRLTDTTTSLKLIDFNQFENNQLHVVTELTYKKEGEEFRPDITLLINGMPLIFIEVKAPSNKDGIQKEYDRAKQRCENKKFKHFINITQFMLFSDNLEYSDTFRHQGTFYATTSQHQPIFNNFREQQPQTDVLQPLQQTTKNTILQDNNLLEIQSTPEFATNKSSDTPTNRLCTSLLSKKRLAFILRYGIVYVEKHEIQKHIMRYPQLFATLAIEQKLKKGERKGIIWHTQGSGKTALTYYNIAYLTDYFAKQNIIPKFYFIVDRLDLLQQATNEFKQRGLVVHQIDSRQALVKAMKSTEAIHNARGQTEITVVNIQKFKDDTDVISKNDYNINIQRIYFLDEAHRSYKPEGSFLADLMQSDRQAIQIGLTGTPLLGDKYDSKSIFGDYIHKYYYDASIKDGYTLRLIREEISTQYKMDLQQALKEAEISIDSLKSSHIYAHPHFVQAMLDYILNDFVESRMRFEDNTIGGMVVCDSSEQARQMYNLFKQDNHNLSAALILHDEETKAERKEKIEQFKDNQIDLLFVYQMLLTGFDAPRLKKLYLGRGVKKHNLLQALARVNRPYKQFQYGYIVDFADISEEFNTTNQAYSRELQAQFGDELHYDESILFLSAQEAQQQIEHIQTVLASFDINNKEIFLQQIQAIEDIAKIKEIQKALDNAKSLYNLIRLHDYHNLLTKLDFHTLKILYNEVSVHLSRLNSKQDIATGEVDLINTAVEDVLFDFTKTGESELILETKIQQAIRQVREALASNIDPKDPEYVKLEKALKKLFQKMQLMESNLVKLEQLKKQVDELNQQNDLIKAQYDNDAKYVRIHKRILEQNPQIDIIAPLQEVKKQADIQIKQNSHLLDNESYFEKDMMRVIYNEFNQHAIELNAEIYRTISRLVVQEYIAYY